MHHDIISSLDQKTVILTPNNRLSLDLIKDRVLFKQQTVLEKPRCLPYTRFLQQLFASLDNAPILLSDKQLARLWWDTLSRSMANKPQVGLIDTVIDAWRKCRQWQLSFDDPAFDYNAQTKLF